jgi:uncharacterized membrane protein (DUF2068 family)
MAKKKRVVKTKETESSKKIPIGVQIISVLYYICVVFFMFFGLLLIIFSAGIASFFATNIPEFATVFTAGAIIGMGIFFVALSILIFFVGRGLWKLKQWARIAAIILSILMIVYIIYLITLGFRVMRIIHLAIHAIIIVYLIFDKEVKKVFR